MIEPGLYEPTGPFHADDLTPGERYELVDGHPMYQAATGGDGASTVAVGVQAIGSDPGAEETGVDPGYVLDDTNVRAPDIAVGNVPDARGFIKGVPRLAVEYAGQRQDEVRLQEKIQAFLSRGTEQIWVVRLIGPRRVEVYRPGAAVVTLSTGQSLLAAGILEYPIPVEALFDKQSARAVALRNYLSDVGYTSIDEIKSAGREEGREQGRCSALRDAIRDVLAARMIAIDPGLDEGLLGLRSAELQIALRRAAVCRTAAEVLAQDASG
ncbi:MAG: Uma2 family endonuclease [Deltaproteobacteria bacterium]|nr:Uma2 family endonuclease [Deltaproteobacteria bacterium]